MDFGHNLGGMIPHPPARSFAFEDVPRGLFVELLTPGKSLFLWAPATLPALLALMQVWRRERGLAGGLAVALASSLVFYAAFLTPEGGYAHGPRYPFAVPLLITWDAAYRCEARWSPAPFSLQSCRARGHRLVPE
jgi:hypothetical protein